MPRVPHIDRDGDEHERKVIGGKSAGKVTADDPLVIRYRESLGGRPGISEKAMMGGICFFHDGNMIGGVDRWDGGRGRYMFRVGKDNEAAALSRDGASAVMMGGRRMGGMVFVEDGACDDDALGGWIALAMGFVAALPPKT